MNGTDYRSIRFCNNANERIDNTTSNGIPIIEPERFIDVDWIGFNYARTTKSRSGKGVHFFIDDYQFERIWQEWSKYREVLSSFDAVMAPDFSMYVDWPEPVQRWNHYRKHFVANRLQNVGLKVYPTICWSDKKSFQWCFEGEPHRSTVCISSIGTQADKTSKRLFLDGYNEMLSVLQPETIIFYGTIPNECKGNIICVQPFQQKFRKAKIACF